MHIAESTESEPKTHSFIIKIWREEIADESGSPVWRGHITHVPSGQRRYVQDLAGIELFIESFVDK